MLFSLLGAIILTRLVLVRQFPIPTAISCATSQTCLAPFTVRQHYGHRYEQDDDSFWQQRRWPVPQRAV